MFWELFKLAAVDFGDLSAEKRLATKENAPAEAARGETDKASNDKATLPERSLKNNDFFTRLPKKLGVWPESFKLRKISLN